MKTTLEYLRIAFCSNSIKTSFKNSDNHLLLENELRGQNTLTR